MRQPVAILLALLIAVTAPGTAVPTEPPPNADDIQKQIDALKKQKELLDAQKALTPDALQLADQMARAKAAKDFADAQKALAEAKKAEAEAQSAAFKATVGDVPASPYSGTIDVRPNTGEIEAALLAARAVREAAVTIDSTIRRSLTANGNIVVMAAADVPTFQSLIAYRAQVGIVRTALEDAIKKATPAPDPKQRITPIVGAAGTVLDAANKLLSFFRTDYIVGGVTVTLDDLLAVAEVANLLRQTRDGKAFVVTIPAIYNPKALSDPARFLVTDVRDLSLKKQEADGLTKAQDAVVDEFSKKANDEKDPIKKAALQKRADDAKALADGLRSASTLFNTWFGKLTVVDDKGTSALVTIVKEKTISDQLATGHFLVLKIQKAGGGYLVKKNMWTFFGGMPLYHMGGAAVSFVLFDGASGNVAVAGVVPVHGGFVKAGNVRATLQN
jgi:hypothetical protein